MLESSSKYGKLLWLYVKKFSCIYATDLGIQKFPNHQIIRNLKTIRKDGLMTELLQICRV
jgi:hypothetical protein